MYSLAVLPTGEVVSGSEDRTARVWRDGKCVGTIAHGGSVWSVAALPDGDIATGCADSVARVFTRDASKVADEAVLQAHEAMIKAQTVSAQEVGGMKMDQLPGTEALEVPGDKDGQTKIFSSGSFLTTARKPAGTETRPFASTPLIVVDRNTRESPRAMRPVPHG